MTSLPISNNQPQSSSNAAHMLPSAIPEGFAATLQPAEPFAFLLAQQIGKTGLPIQGEGQTAVPSDITTGDGATGAQDQAAIDAVPAPDPANALAAMMLQLPPQDAAGQKAENPQTTPLSSPLKADSHQAGHPLVTDSPRKTGDGQMGSAFVPDLPQEPGRLMTEGKEAIPIPVGGHLPTEAFKHPEPPSSALPAPTPGSIQAVASPATPPTTPVLPAGTASVDNALTMSTPFGNNGWTEEFTQKISWMCTQQNQIAELHLNPPNLGPLDVVLKISDNQATALFTSPHGAVREAVENALPKLREILADNGIMLGNASVSDQPPRDRSMDGYMGRDSGAATPPEASGILAEHAAGLSAAGPTSTRRHNGMVDTFA